LDKKRQKKSKKSFVNNKKAIRFAARFRYKFYIEKGISSG